MRVQRGVISYSPRCLSLRVCVATMPLKWQLVLFPAQFSNTHNTRMPPPRCPWATRPIHAFRPKHLPLGAKGVRSKASKCKLPTTHNHLGCTLRHRPTLVLRSHPGVAPWLPVHLLALLLDGPYGRGKKTSA